MPRRPPRAPLRRSEIAIGSALMLVGAAVGAQPRVPAELTVKPHCGPDGVLNSVTIGEKTIDMPKGEDGSNQQLRAVLGNAKPKIRLVADTEVPYRCIGGLIYSLQRLGIPKVAFISQLPPTGEQQ